MGAQVPVGRDAETYVPDQYGESSSAQTIWSPELAEESQAPTMAEEDNFDDFMLFAYDASAMAQVRG